MKPYEDICASCEQNRDQLRSALSEGHKVLLMEDQFAHNNPSKVCVYSTIFELCRPRAEMQSERLWA